MNSIQHVEDSYLLLLASLANLGLGCSPHFVHPVLPLLFLLPAHLGLGFSNTLSDQSVLGLELLSKVHGVVDKGKPGGLSTSELGLETKGENSVRGAVVHLSKLLTDISLGH